MSYSSSTLSTPTRIEDFQGYGHTLYRVVLIIINLKDMTQYDAAANAEFLFGHVVLSYILGIYYLNVLIVSVTLSVSRMSRLSDIIVAISHFRWPSSMTSGSVEYRGAIQPTSDVDT